MGGVLMDWLELMGLEQVIADVLAGRSTVGAATAATSAARTIYPGVSQDYVAVLGRVTKLLDEVSAIVARQAEALAVYNDAIDGFAPRIEPGDRLLRQDEIELMDETIERMTEAQQDRAEQLTELAEEVADLQTMLEELGGGMEGDIEAAADELEMAEAELEAAAAELESYEGGS